MTFVPERWDVGLWDEAHWDGQLGIDAAVTAVTIAPQAANLRVSRRYSITALSTAITITPRSVTFSIGRRLTAASTSVVITTYAANLVVSSGLTINALSTPVTITPQPANLIVTHRLTLTAAPTQVIITGNAADLIAGLPQDLVLQAILAQIHIIPSLADLEIWRNPFPFPQPGRITMGRPKYFVDRW